MDLRKRFSLLSASEKQTYQARVAPWVVQCFGPEVAKDVPERSHRFVEEALELAQAAGVSKRECAELLDYVYGRNVGDTQQEVGGTMVTLAALCTALGIDLDAEAERELTRVKGKTEAIRQKWLSKPKFGPLPGKYLASLPEDTENDSPLYHDAPYR